MSSLQKEVDWILANSQECGLVVIRAPTADRRAMEKLASALHDAQPSPHICLAIQARTLPAWNGTWSGSGRVGLLLDEVDAQTSLSDIASEAIEAFRIAPAFGQRARSHLRSTCILDAMLGLAHEIGLCTFGSPQRSDEANYKFDYVPHSPGKSDR